MNKTALKKVLISKFAHHAIAYCGAVLLFF